MNYLGHAYLSMGNEEVLAGNMMGDYVKGKAVLETYPDGIRKGLMLHRKIDSFTDAHPAVSRAKVFFRKDYDLYAGAIVDIIFDHFLANDPKHFASETALFTFTQNTYSALNKYSTIFPEKFADMFPYMQSQNWLYHYRTLQGAQKSLKGLHHRAKHMPASDDAYKTLIGHYYQLAQCYYEFIDAIIPYVKVELTEQ